ncbi:VWA domain-containing protein [Chitinophagaceae bacterium LB-8]|uniref:VWA domain-containing protein n=1 Tax=Paraflavisolibacter caeni TaxID=2982496 RepID=A0A9X3B9H0_9BACT|nr:VWA domain-containing protein [Paraflavisolibacter caeni]MCU7551960.1 VWA domain-containing protein [Paraflavisolibacter caeni]
MQIQLISLATMLAVLCLACNQGAESSYDKQEVQLITLNESVQSLKQKETNRASVGDTTKENPLNTEDYDNIVENNFLAATQNPLSTFSIDVDEASYSNIRRFINEGSIPPPGAVRIEEMINYFDYDYAAPVTGEPFAVYTEISTCPWNAKHQLIHIGLKGKELPVNNLPSSNLVFLIDVSGSMDEPNKLPLVQQSLKLLTGQLREKDKVAIVVYAGNAGLVLPSTAGDNKMKIKEAIDALQAGGSTAGGEGIQLAYKIARENFIPNGNNRIILATDGDFNVGMSSDDELVRLIEKERQSGVFLSVLGFGMGNYKDGKMQQLAGKGNGNHSYIDNLNEARKVLVSEFGSTLFTIAKDVKLQVEFNPAKVQSYRLIGYENRLLAAEDFNDDAKDAGELGSGHTVTALYEIIPMGVRDEFTRPVDSLKYTSYEKMNHNNKDEVMTIKLRYKEPGGDTSKLMVHLVKDSKTPLESSSDNFRFSAAVAEFGLLLRNSKFKQDAQYSQVLSLASSAKGKDINNYREEFIQLVNASTSIAKK